MDNWEGIDLRGRTMLHAPWEYLKEKGLPPRKKRDLFPQPGEVITNIVTAFMDRRGSGAELISLLNDHIPEPSFAISVERLLDDDTRYSMESYFYIFQFCKFLLGDVNFHYRIDETTQLSVHHRMFERGPLLSPPFRFEEEGPMDGYLSIVNMKSMFAYTEEAAPPPPYADERENEIGLRLSEEGLEMLNKYAPPEYQVKRSFFDKEGILISFEYLFLITCIFEALTNREDFARSSLYYGFLHSSQLARAIFIQPSLTPIEGFQQWQARTNNVYRMDFRQRRRNLWVTIHLKKQYQSGFFGLYRKNGKLGIERACLGVYKAFMELATFKPAKTKIVRSKEESSFTVKIRWKDPHRSKRVYFSALLLGGAALGTVFLLPRLLPRGWHAGAMPLASFAVMAVLSGSALYWRRRLKVMERRFAETKKVIDDQLTSLKKSADDLLMERNSLDRKVKERTAELKEALEQLKALDRGKTNFIANVSHELRTPLTLLSVPLEGIQEGRYGDTIPLKHPIFALVERNIQRLKNQINQLLEFSRLDLGTAPFEPRKLPLVEYCRGLTAELESLAQQKGLSMEVVNRTGREELIIEADEALLETALLNLLNNALKFTDRGGIRLILADLPGEERVRLTVEDTGIGFLPAEKERIFQRFTQAEEHKERHHEGTGLGLALTREIAERHRWDLEVDSRPGEGSSFTLILPLLDEETRKGALSPQARRKERAASGLFFPVPAHEPDHAADKESILLIEDNPDMGTILKDLLGSRYNLHWFLSGPEALAYLKSDPPVSLIICDVMMPGMSGFAFREELMKHSAYRELPFVFLTALADPEDKVTGLKSGAVDYIQKPFAGGELLLKVQNLLESHRATYLQAVRDQQGAARLLRLSSLEEAEPPEPDWPSYGITRAEKRVAQLLRQGLQDKEIAAELSLSPRTVSSHLGNLYRKTETQNRIELINVLYRSSD